MATEQRIYIHGRALANLLERHDFQVADNCGCFRGQFRLAGAHYYILAALAAAAGFIQHAGRFSHSRSVAKKDFEIALIKTLEDRVFVEHVIAGQALQSQTNDVRVMDLSAAGMLLHVQPKLVNELDILALDAGCVRPDSVRVYCSIWAHDVEDKLSFGLGRCFPRLADAETLLFTCQLTGKAGDYCR